MSLAESWGVSVLCYSCCWSSSYNFALVFTSFYDVHASDTAAPSGGKSTVKLLHVFRNEDKSICEIEQIHVSV